MRGNYDRNTVYEIIDEATICHVGFEVNGQPFVIPTIHGRMEDKIVFHGAVASRLLEHISTGKPICVTFTIVDALVLAKSIFHHSMNYRSAVVFGKGGIFESDAEKLLALEAVSEHLLPGRWNEVRIPDEKELNVTTVAYIQIESASAKKRVGPPIEDKNDIDLENWSGVLPIRQTFLETIPADEFSASAGLPDSIKTAIENQNSKR